ncbi:MAG: hypothetical protein ACK4RV_18045 [Caulobacter sp.]
MTDDPDFDSDGGPRHSQEREAVLKAYQEGRFADAYTGLQGTILTESLGYFASAGVHFARPEGDLPPEELLSGLALAASREVEERLPDCPIALMVAAAAIGAVAQLRAALGEVLPPDANSTTQWIARFALLGMELGRADQALHMVRTGAFDALGEMELMKERRRLGAEKTNAKKATAKQSALAEGMRICASNHHLSNEDLALLIRQAANLTTTIKTMTEWVRNWRRTGLLSPMAEP